MTEKRLNLDLTPFNFNGVVHFGAGTGDYAKYYHRLGIHQVLWMAEKKDYVALYENIRHFGMDQTILTPEPNTPFLSIWRQNASYIDPYSYDLLHLTKEAGSNQLQIINGFDYLIENFKAVVVSHSVREADDESLESLLDNLGFKLDSFSGEERLYVKKI